MLDHENPYRWIMILKGTLFLTGYMETWVTSLKIPPHYFRLLIKYKGKISRALCFILTSPRENE